MMQPEAQPEVQPEMQTQEEALKCVNDALRSAGRTDVKCIKTTWRDCDRVAGSSGGSNICDMGLKFRTEEGKPAETGFKLSWENFNPKVGRVDAMNFKVMVCDPDGSNGRLVPLRDALKDMGKLGKHAGVPEDCEDLYEPSVDDQCILYLEAIFAPLGDKVAGSDDPPQREFCLTSYNYTGCDGNGTTLDLAIHPQGCAISDATTGTKMVRAQAYDEEKKVLNGFYFQAEATGKSMDDIHTETGAESAAAAARGKGVAVQMGPPGWDKIPSLFMFIQIPRKMEKWRDLANTLVVPSFYQLPAMAQQALVLNEDDQEEFPEFNSWGQEPMQYRSCGCSDDSPPPGPLTRGLGGATRGGGAVRAPRKEVDIQSCRVSRGEFAGEERGFMSKTMQRERGQRIAITVSLVVGYEGRGAPSPSSVVKVANYLDKMFMVNAGTNQRLMDKTNAAKGTTQLTKSPESVTESDIANADLAKKQKVGGKPKAPIPGMPVVQ